MLLGWAVEGFQADKKWVALLPESFRVMVTDVALVWKDPLAPITRCFRGFCLHVGRFFVYRQDFGLNSSSARTTLNPKPLSAGFGAQEFGLRMIFAVSNIGLSVCTTDCTYICTYACIYVCMYACV